MKTAERKRVSFSKEFKKAPGIIKATIILGGLFIAFLIYLNVAQWLKSGLTPYSPGPDPDD